MQQQSQKRDADEMREGPCVDKSALRTPQQIRYYQNLVEGGVKAQDAVYLAQHLIQVEPFQL
jgi:hypothetical protein